MDERFCSRLVTAVRMVCKKNDPMSRTPSALLGLLSLGAAALAACAVGCSGGDPSVGGFVTDDSGTGGSSSGGQKGGPPSDAAGGSGSSSSGGGSSSGSGSGGGSSSSGSSSGSTGGGDAGRMDAGSEAGGSHDAAGVVDVATNPDTGTTGSDAGLCANQGDWLTPMNQARAMVNAGEPPLVCDPIAAQVALNYANKCVFMHNANRNSDYAALGGTGQVGENLAAGVGQTPAQAVSLWVSEQQYYTHATNTCASGQTCGHYTQVVWKATTAVGCAKVTCTTGSPLGTGGSWDNSVCDFTPAGNYVGQPPY
jgi:pathogenesis-related protein 1